MPADKAKRPGKKPSARKTNAEAFRALFEYSPDPIYIHDLDGRILEANRTASEIMGYSLEEFKRMRVTNVDGEDAAKVPERIKKVLAKTGAIFESVHKKRSGAVFPVEVNARPISYMGKPAIISTIRDITQRKADEERQATLAAITENTNDAIIGLDLDNKVTSWNKGAEKLFGYTEAEIIGKPITILSPDPMKADSQVLLKKVHAGMHLDHIETKRRRKDGQIIDISLTMSPLKDRNGKVTGVSGAAHDITERKRAEELLLESENKFRTLTENSITGVYLIQDGLFKYANPRLEAMFGYEAGELENKKGPQEVLLPEDWPLVRENLRKRLEGESKSENYEFRGVKKNGEILNIEVYGAATKYGGKPAVIGSAIDRTERKKAEQEIHELNLKLEQRVQERTLELQKEVAEHTRTGAALKASETKYRLLFDNIDDTILVHDARGNFFDINRGGLNRLGYSKAEVLSMNLSQFDAPESASRIPVHMAELLKTGHAVFEAAQRRKDGSAVPVEVNAMAIELDGKPAILSVSRDLTARKKAEAALHEQLSILEAFSGLVTLLTMDGLHTYINPAGARMLGYNSPAEIIGKMRIPEVHTPEDLKFVMEVGIPSALRDGHWTAENRLLRPDGSLLPVEQTIFVIRDENGRPRNMGAIMTDLTVRKQAEEEVLRKNAILQTQQDASIDGILMVDKDQRIVNYNERFVEIWGIPEDVLESKSDDRAINSVLSKLVDPEGFVILVKHLYTNKEEKSWDEITFKDGRVLDRYSCGIFGSTGEYYGRIWYFRDITERKKAEERITKLNEDLKRTVEEMEAANRELESFTYSVSHDLRTPLRHMTSFAKLLDEEAGNALKGQTRHYLDVVSGSAKKMDRLITSLLAFSKLARATPEMQEFSGRELVDAVVSDIREDSADREIEWKIGGLPPLQGDRFMIKQVLINLLGNAVKYTGGKKPARIEVFARAEGNETVIGVRDNGIGFDMKNYDRLFGVFQRLHTDKQFEGTGIGLANVKSVISKHGGRVWAESVPDKETTFYFSLPAAGTVKGTMTK